MGSEIMLCWALPCEHYTYYAALVTFNIYRYLTKLAAIFDRSYCVLYLLHNRSAIHTYTMTGGPSHGGIR